ncbi:AP-3 complex subunit sigma isoform X2 [Brachypodium distachyon]|uniref:AP-3 complex subunit sigma isoform X2 n=1 Tax=Brachypodium distachyon TaxID=15368 RepID=UPI0001C76823|nr:AP-3 complex subunit sigma isoform X2 [Brachypodium distachyon]|eukprot:XP_010228929.1 AP-3 complex subunit sigma isoform X2 [Brachypodium distachyon]
MIQAVMVISTQGKPRLLKFYNFQPPEKHQELVRGVFQLLSARPENVSNFVEADAIFGPGAKLVYKHLATLYFVFIFDSSENELAMLDLVQVFVETLDRCFKNVCELDIVFNFNKVIETSSEQIVKSVEEIARLEKQSSTASIIPKSISDRFSR